MKFYLFIYFEYDFIPSGAAGGIQRCCLASTLRISDTGVGRPHDILEFRGHLRRSRGFPSAWMVGLALPAVCSAAVSAVCLRRSCFSARYIFKNSCLYTWDVSLCHLELPAVYISGVAGDTLQRGWLSWRCQLYAALLFRRFVYDEVASAARYLYKYIYIYIYIYIFHY